MDKDRIMSNEELTEERRKRQMAIIKASNQMLNEAMQKALDNTSDPLKRTELQMQFSKAIDENEAMAKSYLHATMDEVEKSEFRDADEIYVKKFRF